VRKNDYSKRKLACGGIDFNGSAIFGLFRETGR
jgi:hypothetical protein